MDNMGFIDFCQYTVAKYNNEVLVENNDCLTTVCKPSDVSIVWITKTIQNNKALCIIKNNSPYYFEVTRNGDKNETYMDIYIKQGNKTISDDEYRSYMPVK